jgi:hydroxyethylthiazole kinase-like uncharacterized protein yjeF
MKVLSAAQMREVDRLTSERYAIPSLLLMEEAAARTLEVVERKYGSLAGKRALIICGKGNNGGDGAAIARQLWMRRARVTLLLLGKVDEARGDARTNFDIVRAIAGADPTLQVIEVETSEHFWQQASSRTHDIIFDAIFGTGLARPATGIFEEAIRFLNRCAGNQPVIAVDIPSGIASDSFELIGPAVRAHLTVSFTAPKIANVLPPASDYSGELVVVHIGSPAILVNSSGSQLNLVERSDVEAWLASSRRSPHANKGDVGKVLIVAGSRGKTGAACLVGEAAMRAGAGLVTVATPASSQPVVASHLIEECMTEPLAETGSGTIAREAVERTLELAAERDVVAIGPGIGSSEEATRMFVRAVTLQRQRPMVIDADGLNSLAPWAENLRGSSELPLILTPHPGEMARLVGKPIAEVIRNRVELSRRFATEYGVILVLKGSRTLIAAPDGEVYVNPTGNAGMATGGSGDVLTGVIAGLLAGKRDDPLKATIAAVYLHGLAGDIAASEIGTRAMIASDITAHLGDAFIQIGGPWERLRN